jgi:hypothetical protein
MKARLLTAWLSLKSPIGLGGGPRRAFCSAMFGVIGQGIYRISANID